MTAGVYVIANTVTGCRYIGGSLNTDARWRTHLQDLKRGEHPNWRLQADWRRYGAEAFVFRVLEPMMDAGRPTVEDAERRWIESFAEGGISSLYNVTHARAPRGAPDPRKLADALCVHPRDLIGAEE